MSFMTRKMHSFIKKYRHALIAALLILTLSVMFALQLEGINLSLTDKKYISAAYDLIDLLPTASLSNFSKITVIFEIDTPCRVEELYDLLLLNERFTFSILPFLDNSAELAKAVYSRGNDILLQIPKYYNTDSSIINSTINASMTETDIHNYLDNSFDKIPMAVGISNYIPPTSVSNDYILNSMLAYLSSHGKYLIDNTVNDYNNTGVSLRGLSEMFNMKNMFYESSVSNADASGNSASVNDIKLLIKAAVKYSREYGHAVLTLHLGSKDYNCAIASSLLEMLPWLFENNVCIVGFSNFVK